MAPYPGSNAGIGYERIANLAGVNPGVLRGLLYGSGSPPSVRVHQDHAKALLEFRAQDRLRAPGSTVDARPAVRLAECIHHYGISKRSLGAALGTKYPGVRFRRTITVKRSEAIAALHWEFYKRDIEFRRRCECPLPREVESWLEAS
jgi:hypothetical protein